MNLLNDTLSRMAVDELKSIAHWLPRMPTSGPKHKLLEFLGQQLSGAPLKTTWNVLDDTQRLAVAEAVHEPLGRFFDDRFRAKYGRPPGFSTPPPADHKRLMGPWRGKPTALGLFLYWDRDGSCQVPSDLRKELQAFVPEPVPVELQVCHELPPQHRGHALTVRTCEREALIDLAVMLRLADQGRIQVSDKTSQPGAGTMRLLAETLTGGDFYAETKAVVPDPEDETAGPIKAFAWPLLLQAAGLMQRQGSKSALTPAGRKALGTAPRGHRDCAAGLPRGHLGRRGQPVTPHGGFGQRLRGRARPLEALPRRGAIRQPGLQRLAGLEHPAVALPAVPAVRVRRAAGAGGCGLWGADELPYLSRYDGLCCIRLTALGAYCLGLAKDYTPSAAPTSTRLSVMPSLQVHVAAGPLAVEEALMLETWAAPLTAESWQLDRQKALAAVESGHDTAELQAFLQARDEQPLPQPVEAFLAACQKQGRALRIAGAAVLVECQDAATAATLATHKETAGLCLAAGERHLVVRSEHQARFRAAARVLGFGMPPG